jgi:hypothetical protein
MKNEKNNNKERKKGKGKGKEKNGNKGSISCGTDSLWNLDLTKKC